MGYEQVGNNKDAQVKERKKERNEKMLSNARNKNTMSSDKCKLYTHMVGVSIIWR